MEDDVTPTPEPVSATTARAKSDRWDRRFRIEGDPIEALQAVLVERPPKKS